MRGLYEVASSLSCFSQDYAERKGWKYPQIHEEMADWLQHAGMRAIGIKAFRNSSKSTKAQIYCAWRLLLEPNLKIMVLSADTQRARNFAKHVNRLLREIPWTQHLAPREKKIITTFNVRGIIEEEQASLSSFSVLSNFTGYRADLIILDDPIGTKQSWSLARTEQVLTALPEVYQLLHPPGRHFTEKGLEVPDYAKTQIVVLYTPHESQPLDAYTPSELHPNHFMRGVAVADWAAILDPEYDENGLLTGGRSAWSERFEFELLQSEQHLHPHAFRLERQVDSAPYDDETCLIPLSKVPQDSIKGVNLACYCDPSGGGDEWAIAFGGLLRDEQGTRIYLDRVTGWRGLDPDDAAIKTLDLMQEHGVRRIKVEEDFPAAGALKRFASQRNQPLAIEAFKTRQNKEMKIKKALPPLFASGSVVLNPSILNDPKTVEQFRGVKAGRGRMPPMDDRLDAIYFCIDDLRDSVRTIDPTEAKKPKKRYRFA